jgi:hypothetical protein
MDGGRRTAVRLMTGQGERSTREWALVYASLGWRVFPVVSGGKRPIYGGWQRDATTDPDLIARHWRSEPGPNIGIICGEAFVAFDVEADHLPALSAWMRQRRYRLPETPMARTGRGGIHILVEPFGASGRDLYLGDEHIDELKSTGAFIVATPSVTVASYRWSRRPGPVASAPPWLLALLERPVRPRRRWPIRIATAAHGRRRLDALACAVRSSPEGRRNNHLYWAVRRALEEGIPPRYASLALMGAAIGAGLSEREAAATIGSAIGAQGGVP